MEKKSNIKTEKKAKEKESKQGKNKGGRPKKKISKKQFEELCKIQCTEKEICGVLDVTDKTLTRWCKETYDAGFSDVYKKKSANGKTSLRRYQMELAKTNPSMAIFLGKVYLNQQDKNYNVEEQIMPEMKISIVDNSALEKTLYEGDKK